VAGASTEDNPALRGQRTRRGLRGQPRGDGRGHGRSGRAGDERQSGAQSVERATRAHEPDPDDCNQKSGRAWWRIEGVAARPCREGIGGAVGRTNAARVRCGGGADGPQRHRRRCVGQAPFQLDPLGAGGFQKADDDVVPDLLADQDPLDLDKHGSSDVPHLLSHIREV
jgi:hypothetical protein